MRNLKRKIKGKIWKAELNCNLLGVKELGQKSNFSFFRTYQTPTPISIHNIHDKTCYAYLFYGNWGFLSVCPGDTFLVPGATVATLLMLGALHARRMYEDKKVFNYTRTNLEFFLSNKGKQHSQGLRRRDHDFVF